MENFGRVLTKLLVEAKEARVADMGEREISYGQLNLAESKNKKTSAEFKRSVNLGIKSLVRALSEDKSWQAVQAKRKFEKEDMLNNNPSFDPIFMKV